MNAVTLYTPRETVWIFPWVCLWLFFVCRAPVGPKEKSLKSIQRKWAKENAKLRKRLEVLDTKYECMIDKLEFDLTTKLEIYNAENQQNFVRA